MKVLTVFFAVLLAWSQVAWSQANGAMTGAIADTSPVPQPNASWMERHLAVLAELKTHPDASLLFVGDSITQNYERPEIAPVWKEYFAPHGALNLGFSGDRTEHVLWRLQHGEVDGLHPANVVLLIGTNNTWHDAERTVQAVTTGIEAVVAELHTRLPAAKILVLGILPSTVSAQKSAKDSAINQALASKYAGSRSIRVLDLAPLFMKNNAVDLTLFSDPTNTPPGPAVHPNPAGQRLMAERVAQALYH